MEPIWWVVIIGTVIVSSAGVLGALWWGEYRKRDGSNRSRRNDAE